MDSLRVLVIAPTPFFGDRGCHVRIYEEIRALAALGIQSSVVTYPTGRDLPDIKTVRARAFPGIKAGPLGFSAGRPLLDLAVFLKSHREVARFHPHLLHLTKDVPQNPLHNCTFITLFLFLSQATLYSFCDPSAMRSLVKAEQCTMWFSL